MTAPHKLCLSLTLIQEQTNPPALAGYSAVTLEWKGGPGSLPSPHVRPQLGIWTDLPGFASVVVSALGANVGGLGSDKRKGGGGRGGSGGRGSRRRGRSRLLAAVADGQLLMT